MEEIINMEYLSGANDRILNTMTSELGIKKWQAEAVIDLIDDGSTIPFIARYRKEATGALNDELLRNFEQKLNYYRHLEERKSAVISAIDEQGKLTDELSDSIIMSTTLIEVEDLYRPYKLKRKTRASIAKEKGFSGLADYILDLSNKEDAASEAKKYLDSEQGVNTVDDALSYAMDIIAGDISDNISIRASLRDIINEEGKLVCKMTSLAEDEIKKGKRSVYENYFDFSQEIKKIPGHRILAMNRGENEKYISVKVDISADKMMEEIFAVYLKNRFHINAKYIIRAAEDSYKRLMFPSVENDIRAMLTEKAENGAIEVFASNLRQLLMQAPVTDKVVMGWDPAFRTGCKLAICDSTGKLLATKVIYPTAPQNKVAEAEEILEELISKYDVDIISVGNGTASRESELIIADFIKKYRLKNDKSISYVIVNEAGASVYSASKLASEEYPDLDVGERSAMSIARRLQDPLAELVKIDPKSIGVGQYQHDMNKNKLGEALNNVVEDCVNAVGIDLNTASFSLLRYVSGINANVAANIVSYREENGKFDNRKELLNVPKLGAKAFSQCAGFCRISGGSEPLDASAVHPESYGAARKILAGADAKTAGVGEYTYNDIIAELKRPGRDPRNEVEAPILRTDVMNIEDLKADMVLKGTVRNIVDFGAFVDIGVHQDGLVHISQLADKYVKHPLDVVKVGDIVNVKVLSVDIDRKKISLSMRDI